MKIKDVLLFESFPLAKKEFSQEADPAEVEKYISKYREYLKQSFVSGEDEKDINYWRKKGFESFKEWVHYLDDMKERNSEIKRRTKDFLTIENNDKYKIVVPLNYHASQKLGRRSTWCTSSSSANSYFKNHFNWDKNIKVILLSKSDYNNNFAIMYSPNGEAIEIRDLTQEKDHGYNESTIRDLYRLTIDDIWKKLERFKDKIGAEQDKTGNAVYDAKSEIHKTLIYLNSIIIDDGVGIILDVPYEKVDEIKRKIKNIMSSKAGRKLVFDEFDDINTLLYFHEIGMNGERWDKLEDKLHSSRDIYGYIVRLRDDVPISKKLYDKIWIDEDYKDFLSPNFIEWLKSEYLKRGER